MQVLEIHNNTDRKPSKRLQEKIRNCVSVFRSLNETVNEVIELGKSEGFSLKEIGQFIRNEMLKSGLSRRTVTNYLPAELKAKPRGIQVQVQVHGHGQIRENNSLKPNQIQLQQLNTKSKLAAQNKQLPEELKFSAAISHMGKKKFINIPKDIHSKIEKFEGKTLNVAITIDE